MNFKKLQDKAVLKMVLPMVDSFLMPFISSILTKAEFIKINTETESEVGLLLLARGKRIIVCAPVFSKSDCIVRYEAISEKGEETVDLTELIKDFKSINMPSPKEANKTTENEFLEFLEQPVQEFEAPDLPEPEAESDPFDLEEDETESLTPSERKKKSGGMAIRYVKLFDKGFSNLAASYSSGEAKEYKIDESDQEDLAEPLAELIAENKLLDLPPGWALIITALIIYAPLTMKAVQERKDIKALKEAESKKNKLTKDDDKEVEENDDK